MRNEVSKADRTPLDRYSCLRAQVRQFLTCIPSYGIRETDSPVWTSETNLLSRICIYDTANIESQGSISERDPFNEAVKSQKERTTFIS